MSPQKAPFSYMDSMLRSTDFIRPQPHLTDFFLTTHFIDLLNGFSRRGGLDYKDMTAPFSMNQKKLGATYLSSSNALIQGVKLKWISTNSTK